MPPLEQLRSLKLNDNPLACTAPNVQAQQQLLPSRDRERYLCAVRKAAPWLSELDGELLAPPERRRAAMAAAAGSPEVALAARRTLSCATASFVALLPVAAVARGGGASTSSAEEEAESGACEAQSRLLLSLASTSCGRELPRAGVPPSLLCLALPRPSSVPTEPAAASSTGSSSASTGSEGGWLRAAERAWAAGAPCATAALQASDMLWATQGQRPGEEGGPPNQSAAALCVTLDSRPLAGFAALSTKLKSLHLGGGVGGESVALIPSTEATLQFIRGQEDALSAMKDMHVKAASQKAIFASSWASEPGVARSAVSVDDGEFELRPSYYVRLLEEAAGAATVLQSVWRAKRARLEAATLSSAQHRLRMAAAAVRIQAAWRGRSVRIGAGLRALREGAARRRQAAEAADRERRHAAAARIQAAARGMRVRRRLAAAVRAARYDADGDDDEGFDFDVDAVEGLMSGLKGVEEFLKAEEPAFMAAAQAAMQQRQQPASVREAAALAPPTGLPPLSPMRPPGLPGFRPPALVVPAAAGASPATVQAWIESHPGEAHPPSPTSTVRSGAPAAAAARRQPVHYAETEEEGSVAAESLVSPSQHSPSAAGAAAEAR